MVDADKYEAMELEQMIHDAGYPDGSVCDPHRYEGYTKGEWTWLYNDEVPVHLLVVPQGAIGIGVAPEDNVSQADMRLIADAPLLLEEVKRLREDIISVLGAIDLTDYDEFPLTQGELRNMMTKYGQEHLIHEGEE